jgi:dGTPase
MSSHAGFEHNRQGLRIVEELEYRYADFPGLNLSWEVREAQARHSKNPQAAEIAPYLAGGALLEAQVVDAADSLAYDSHDVDDALSLGLIAAEDLRVVPLWEQTVERVHRSHPQLGALQFQGTVVRGLIDWQVSDLLEQTRHLFKEERIARLEDVRSAQNPLVGPSPAMRALKAALELFLHERVYRHHRVLRMAYKGQRILESLFEEYEKHPDQLPDRYQRRLQRDGLERTVCDYLAGMTDRFAQDEYLRLFQPYVTV